MFIIIIVVIAIVLYLAQINSRINNLENKIKNINSIPKVENTEFLSPQIETLYHAETKPEMKVQAPTFSQKDPIPKVEHQDVFAKNLAKVGITVLILGVLFFLKYIDSQGLIGPVFKYVSGLVFGVILLSIAEYLKNKNKSYVNLLRGGSFVIFYLTLFVGFFLFHIVSLAVTLGLVAAVLAISIMISMRENDQVPFTLGALGAYIVSLLIGLNFYNIGNENLIGILAYVLIINTAIIFISLKKDWINSAVIGFVFTWLIFSSVLSTTIGKNVLFIFSTLYGLQYLMIFLIQDFQSAKSKISGTIQATVLLTVINTIVYLMVFYKLVSKTALFDYVGFFVALLGVFHFMVYMFMRNINKDSESFVTLTHFVISILLISVAIPLQFDGPLVTMIWFMEGIVLSFLSVLKDFKNKSIMYVLGFTSIIAGIIHMISFGDYEDVFKNGVMFLNQFYIVWFAVFILINIVAYIWYNTVSDSEDGEFKHMINKIAFVLIIVGQVMFIGLTSMEINNFGSYREITIRQQINEEMELDRKLEGNDYSNKYDYNYESKYKEEYEEMNSVSRQTTFMQMLLFILMTIIYFIIGLVKKNKTIRNMGILTLIITSILLIALAWEMGAVYRIITFIGFGIALLIVSYLYISKNKKLEMNKTLMLLLMIGLFATNVNAKVINTNNWTSIADLKLSSINVGGDTVNNENLYVIPVDKDMVILSKRNDLNDIRLIDKDKNEIPYLIVKSNQNTQSIKDEKGDVKILENSITRDGKKILVIDVNREGYLYNKLSLTRDSKSVNFRKKVKVFISDTFLTASSPAWKELEQKNVIYNYTDAGNFSVENLDINLSGVSSKYIKIELTDDIDFSENIKVSNKLTVLSAQVEFSRNGDKTLGYKVKDYLTGNFVFDNLQIFKDIKLTDNVQIGDRSELTYEGDIDVEELTLRIDENDKDFNRSVVIQGSNDDINWVTLTNDNIYRIDSPIYKGEKLSISMPVSTYKKFKVIVQDNNNKPLNVLKTAKVKIQNTGIIFKLDDGINLSDIKVVVGNNTELPPVYDIKSIINYFENSTPQIIEYQNLVKNPDYRAIKPTIPFGEKNKVLLNLGLLLFIIIIGVFGFFWMKKDQVNE